MLTYCSRECQKEHWITHKELCSAMAIEFAAVRQKLVPTQLLAESATEQIFDGTTQGLLRYQVPAGEPIFRWQFLKFSLLKNMIALWTRHHMRTFPRYFWMEKQIFMKRIMAPILRLMRECKLEECSDPDNLSINPVGCRVHYDHIPKFAETGVPVIAWRPMLWTVSAETQKKICALARSFGISVAFQVATKSAKVACSKIVSLNNSVAITRVWAIVIGGELLQKPLFLKLASHTNSVQLNHYGRLPAYDSHSRVSFLTNADMLHVFPVHKHMIM